MRMLRARAAAAGGDAREDYRGALQDFEALREVTASRDRGLLEAIEECRRGAGE